MLVGKLFLTLRVKIVFLGVYPSNLQITKFCFNLVFLERLTELCHTKFVLFNNFILSNSKKCLRICIICEKVVIFATTYYAESVSLFSQWNLENSIGERMSRHLAASYLSRCGVDCCLFLSPRYSRTSLLK